MKDPIEEARQRLIDLMKKEDHSAGSGSLTVDNALEMFSQVLEELRVADEALRQQNEELASAQIKIEEERRRYQELFDMAPDAYLLTDAKGLIIEANQAASELMAYPLEHLRGKPILVFVHFEDVRILNQILTRNATIREASIRIRPRSMKIVHVSMTTNRVPAQGGQKTQIRWILRDITDRVKAEKELTEMRNRMLENGEAERLRLAQELHDGPMQDLYGAVFHLTGISGLDEEGQARIEAIQEILRRVAGTLRTVCGELRPPTLANLGLERAIRSHAEQTQELHPEMTLELHLTKDGQALSSPVRMALFRIYQQCMANILRHSQASRVSIFFDVNEKEAVLDIWDNGKGFTLPEKWVDLLREGHYGLAGIAERVEALGGELKIDTRPGAGTLVHVSAPVDRKMGDG